MKAHIARNQNAGIPLALGWNLSAADRGILEGMAPAFGMKLQLVSPADAGRTVAQLLGEVEVKTTRTLVLEPGAYPPALVLANFKDINWNHSHSKTCSKYNSMLRNRMLI